MPAEAQAEVHVLEVGRDIDDVEAAKVEEDPAAKNEARAGGVVDRPPKAVSGLLRIAAETEEQRVRIAEEEATGFLQGSVDVQDQGSSSTQGLVLVQGLQERGQPAGADETIAVEKNEIRRRRQRSRLVGRRPETAVGRVEDEPRVQDFIPQSGGGVVGGGVVDDDDLVAGIGIREEALEGFRNEPPTPRT